MDRLGSFRLRIGNRRGIEPMCKTLERSFDAKKTGY